MATSQPSAPSFVPHARSSRKKGDASSVMVVISFFIFLVSAGLAAGVFFYDQYLDRSLEVKKEEAAEAESKLDTREAEELIRLSKRMEYSRELLEGHAVVSPFYKVLEEVTLPSIQFNSIEISRTGDVPVANLSGTARGYPWIALQSDAFSKSAFFKNPVFENFNDLENGQVTFSLTFEVDPSLFQFAGTLK